MGKTSADQIKIKTPENQPVNPATEDKQDDIINSIKGDWYDKQEIDLSDENNIVIAYKKNDTTILTETIVIDGDNITITKT